MSEASPKAEQIERELAELGEASPDAPTPDASSTEVIRATNPAWSGLGRTARIVSPAKRTISSQPSPSFSER